MKLPKSIHKRKSTEEKSQAFSQQAPQRAQDAQSATAVQAGAVPEQQSDSPWAEEKPLSQAIEESWSEEPDDTDYEIELPPEGWGIYGDLTVQKLKEEQELQAEERRKAEERIRAEDRWVSEGGTPIRRNAEGQVTNVAAGWGIYGEIEPPPDLMPEEEHAGEEVDHTQFRPSKAPYTAGQELRMMIIKIVYVLAAFFIIFTFVFGLHRNLSAGMQPSLRDGDLLFYYRLDKNLRANNIVVYKYKDELIAGRVIAVEGDTVDITENGLVINGSVMFEPDIYSKTTQLKGGPTFPLKVEKDTVFVLGDNREHANDSRIIGLIHKKDIQGKVMGVIRRRNL